MINQLLKGQLIHGAYDTRWSRIYLAKIIVQGLDGALDITSSPGQGITYTIVLPQTWQGSMQEVNALVLATDIHSKSVTPLLQKVGFNVVTLYPKTLNGVIGDIDLVGKITGKENTASELTASLNKRIQAVASAAINPAAVRPLRTLLIIWYDPLMVAGAGTLPDDMLKVAGGKNIASDMMGYSSIGLETIISRDPEVIIVPSDMGQPDNPLWDFVITDARLKNTTATKDKAIYKIDGDLVLRYGPRCITALEQMSSFYHPSQEVNKQPSATN